MCDAFLKVRCDTVNVKFVPHTQIRMTDQGGDEDGKDTSL